MKNKIINLIMLACGGLFAFANTGCSSDFATGAIVGGVVGGVIGHEIGDNDRDDRQRRRRHYRRRYHNYSEGLHLNFHSSVNHDSRVISEDIARTFKMPVGSAEYFIQAAMAADEGDLTHFERLGLDSGELARLANLEIPSSKSMQQFSQTMQMSPDKVRQMFSRLVTEAKSQFSDINSEVWQICTNARKWGTPQNHACMKTFWDGCSPSTGATACAPAR